METAMNYLPELERRHEQAANTQYGICHAILTYSLH